MLGALCRSPRFPRSSPLPPHPWRALLVLVATMGAFTKRRDSEYEGEDSNLNVTWISSPFSWVFYVLLIAAFRWALYYFVPATVCSWELGWTVTHIAHGVVRVWQAAFRVFCALCGFQLPRFLLLSAPQLPACTPAHALGASLIAGLSL